MADFSDIRFNIILLLKFPKSSVTMKLPVQNFIHRSFFYDNRMRMMAVFERTTLSKVAIAPRAACVFTRDSVYL
jgi:hypothetical protein